MAMSKRCIPYTLPFSTHLPLRAAPLLVSPTPPAAPKGHLTTILTTSREK